MEDIKILILRQNILSLKVKWVSRRLDNNFHPWKLIPNSFFSKVGGNKTIFHFNLQLSKACLAEIKKFPLFYQHLVQIWAKVSKRDPIETSDPAYEICKEALWNNSCITSGGKSLYNQYFITKGIMCIIDIMDEKGNLLESEKAKQKYVFNMFSNLSWLGLIKSIPAVWKSNLRNSFSGSPPRTELQSEDIACIDSKMAYLKIIQPIKTTDISTIFRKGARFRQDGVEEGFYVAKNGYNRLIFTFISV